MELDPDACYRALETRDARFDGRFFTAVRSTGVYCRPVCPARTPKRENCTFLRCAAAAQEAGFRPCLRCRPEASPGTPAWQGTSATVSRALRLIGEGALDTGTVDALAGRLGIGERHLRRLFLEHLGASPLAVAGTQRLLFAKKLIDETALPMSEVAFAAGFTSIRRFNHAVREAWGKAPRDLRRAVSDSASAGSPALILRLAYRPPLDWQALTGFFALRAIPGVETVNGECYARSIRIDEVCGLVLVRHAAKKNLLLAELRLSGPAPLVRIAERLRNQFDLTADPEPIAAHLRRDEILSRSLRARPGLRVPGAWDGFELAVRAILGQQVSVRGASTLAGRLVEGYGEKLPENLVESAGGKLPSLMFPRPEALVDVDGSAIGLTGARARAIAALARGVVAGEIDLSSSRGLGESVEQLCALPGVGEWTAQYIAMRALREPDAFPSSDLGLRRALRKEDDGSTTRELPSAREVAERAERWRPWRAYAAVHLWTGAPTQPTRETQKPTEPSEKPGEPRRSARRVA